MNELLAQEMSGGWLRLHEDMARVQQSLACVEAACRVRGQSAHRPDSGDMHAAASTGDEEPRQTV